MSSPTICTEIVKCLESLWSKKQLIDFTVKIDKESIECHRFILAACSDFFQALFNSGMKEVTENCVVLKNISVAVFELVLKSVYTGVNVLTLENFLEVWRAVHQLQIKFLKHLCEEFAIKSISIDTWENTHKTASLLDSKPVLQELHLFMLKNFEKICQAPTFLLLPFNEVTNLIKSQDLVISREDLVLESVINLVVHVEDNDNCDQFPNEKVDNVTESNRFDSNNENDFGLAKSSEENVDSLSLEFDKLDSDEKFNMKDTNNISTRISKLTELLKLVRTCLVSPTVLSRVFKLRLVIENEEARNIIFNASMYHSLDIRHGQWPSTAVHRLSSQHKHYGV